MEGDNEIQTPWRDYQRFFSYWPSGALSLGITSGSGEQKKLVDGAEAQGALKILGTEWKLVCPKCSEEEGRPRGEDTRDANKPGSGWAV